MSSKPSRDDVTWLHEQLDAALAGREPCPTEPAARPTVGQAAGEMVLGAARTVGWLLRWYATLAAPTQVVFVFVALFVVAFMWGRSGW